MKVYLVGGAVRDRLLGLPVKDRDYVVVGATPEQMTSQGFLPVGRDFPVFLHPQTHEEYALARTERKQGHGYRGFVIHTSPEVRLEEDLARRDLTINAIAEAEDGQLVDPFGGQQDLKAGILRHVSPAFVEDPVRVLRLARFAARFDFRVAPETERLMQQMVANGELEHLVAERVWSEIARALQEARPGRFFKVLHDSGALAVILPELLPEAESLAAAATDWPGRTLAERFATLVLRAGLSESVLEQMCRRLRTPQEIKEFARLALLLYPLPVDLDCDGALDLIERSDALRRPDRLHELLDFLSTYDAASETTAVRLRQGLERLQGINAGAIARQQPNAAAIKEALRQARLAVLADSFPCPSH